MRNAVETCLVLGGIGLLGYFYVSQNSRTMSFGPVVRKITKSEKANQFADASLQEDKHLKWFVIEGLTPIFADLAKKYGIGMPHDTSLHFKKRGDYFRIMGSAPRGKQETVVFVFVLQEGKQVFAEVGHLETTGTYPEDVFK